MKLSELKVIDVDMMADVRSLSGQFYRKSEADKYIKLLKDKANYNEFAYKLKSEELADTCRFYEDELRHQKYRRCLAMARWCLTESVYFHYRYDDWGDKGYDRRYKWKKVVFWKKWARYWLKLAEQFKEERSKNEINAL